MLGVTGNVELSKEFLHRNSNFMSNDEGNKAGCRFIRKLLSERDPHNGEVRVDFVQSIHDFEERFLSEDDKNFLLKILKSLARGNDVLVKKIEAPQVKIVSKSVN